MTNRIQRIEQRWRDAGLNVWVFDEVNLMI
jgi:hypothetical protein